MLRRGLAGHSKWANIKHKKGAKDAKRGAVITKLCKRVEAAARLCDGDVTNPALASAIERARNFNVPKATLDKAIQRKKGDLEALRYEGRFSEVSVIVEALTDNRTRTGQELRALFRKHGGQFASVFGWTHVGSLRVSDVVLVDGVLDFDDDAVYTEPANLLSVKAQLERDGIQVHATDLVWRPSSYRSPSDPATLISALDALDDHDDVAAVFHDAILVDR